MKLSILASILSTGAAFSPSSNKASFTARNVATEPEVATGPSTEPVDKTLAGIDDGAEHDVFDPLGGDAPALVRNNNEEVWVPQVSYFIARMKMNWMQRF